MSADPRRAAVALFTAALALSGCAATDKASTGPKVSPATVEKLAGSELSKLTLTGKAVERLGIQVARALQSGKLLAVPYSAVVYDTKGQAWLFVNPAPGTYQRAQITVESMKDGTAYLTAGPPAGTPVVSTGAAELYGAELGIGK
ncbi:hypothetical protein [Nonomuraea endophytica]|uniref:DUF192 domain-containing protein n=1 Tax=Nonomuraea endophytica TaxID=714136 RepID=A0A7W8AA94_9ACTN|nr:hypothetical protein [Nonomuraea endophytica]MBB5081934.1 hypothetical protein [Nonomuraea endophytica]